MAASSPAIRAARQAQLSDRPSRRKDFPRIAEIRDRLIVVMPAAARHIVQSHRADLPPNCAHHSRCRHDVLVDLAAVEPTANPNVVHIKRARWRGGIIPKLRIEETRLDKITSAAGDHRDLFWFANPVRTDGFCPEPYQVARHQRAAKTKRRVRKPSMIMKISLERIAGINAIVVHHHDQRIAATRGQLFLHHRNKFCRRPPILVGSQDANP